ncbi:MAG: hypothetical protein RR821_09310, partial [Clostridia bacterium]
ILSGVNANWADTIYGVPTGGRQNIYKPRELLARLFGRLWRLVNALKAIRQKLLNASIARVRLPQRAAMLGKENRRF